MDYLERLKRAMMGEDTQDIQIPMSPLENQKVSQSLSAPEEIQDAKTDAELAEINTEAKSPNQMTKPELAQKEVQQQIEQTVPGQLAERNPASEQPDNYLSDLKANIEKYKREIDKTPEQNDVMNWLTGIGGAANVLAKLQGRSPGKVDYWGDKQAKSTASKKKEKLNNIQQLQKMYQDYNKALKEDKMTPYQEATLKSQQSDRELRERITALKKKGAPATEFDKALAKKQAADFADSQAGLQKTATALYKVEDALDAQLQYTKDSLLGTGPLATLGGLTKYGSSETEGLEAKFKEIDLKNMVSTFSGMSKAVDSDAERKAWKSTQASVANDDKTNVQILLGSKSSLLKDRAIAEAKASHVKEFGNLDGFTHPILEGKVTTLITPSGEMRLVQKNKANSMKDAGYRTVDQFAKELLSGKSGKSESVTMIAPNGEERTVRADMVQKYIDKGAKIKE